MAIIKRTQLLIYAITAFLLTACVRVSTPQAAPVPVHPQLGSGVAHSCLLTQEGRVFCWGQGAQPGREVHPQTFGIPIEVEKLDAISLGAGWYHTCTVTRDGHVRCWGQNTYGQLGNGTMEESFSPVEVTGLEEITTVSAGATHSCALTASGDVHCWGQNSQGQVGDGSTTDRPSPVRVAGLGGRAAGISAGPSYTCAILAGGQVQCWGQFTFLPGQLGQDIHTSPVSIPGLEVDVEEIAAGDYHLCLLAKSGQVRCEGSLFTPGDPLFGKPTESLGSLQGHILDLLAGADFTCILADSGKVYCWGDDSFDQIGDGTFVTAPEPKEVSRAGMDVIALGGGHYTACALAADGKTSCWGDTSFGQTGDGTARWK
jgi:hypothetical protein